MTSRTDRPAAPEQGSEPLEFLRWLLRDEPRVEPMDTGGIEVHLHVEGETYWRISGTDLHALLEARKAIVGAAS